MRLQGVILDWAGTTVDHGSRAPVATLQKIFADAGIPISVAEARESMGIAKKEHIRSILGTPRIRQEWLRVHGATPSTDDLDALYADFIPRQIECLGDHSAVIRGVPAAVERMRSRGMKIGTTTGYTRPMLSFLMERARAQGFDPDCSLCPDDVPAGRPAPWMCYLNAIRLQAYPLWAFVKIGDTPSDIAEGRNAGMWTIGVTRTGNETGLTETEWDLALEAEKKSLLAAAAIRLKEAGAHFIAESAAECDELFDRIDGCLRSEAKP